MPASSDDFKKAFARHPAGVAVALWTDRSQVRGMTLSSVASVSADPPHFIFSVAARSARLPSLLAAPDFSINLLAYDDVHLARSLTLRGNSRVPGDRVSMRGGPPVLHGARASLVAHLVSRFETGPSVLLLAEARLAQTGDDNAAPLIYLDREYCGVQKEAGDPAV